MRCRRCGRQLKDEASVSQGYGPVCFKKQQLNNSEQLELEFENTRKSLFEGLSLLDQHKLVLKILGLK